MCLRSCLKSLLILINIGFLLIGGCFLAFGIMLKQDISVAMTEKVVQIFQLNQYFHMEQLSPVFIILGAVVLFISLLGFLGGCFRSKLLLYLYSGILITLTICELIAFILILTNRTKLETWVKNNLLNLLDQLHKNNKKKIVSVFANLHRAFDCCGVMGPDDFKGNEQLRNTCIGKVRGCLDVVIEFVELNAKRIGAFAAGFMIVQIIAIVASVANGCGG